MGKFSTMPVILTTSRLILRAPIPLDREKLIAIFDERTIQFYPYVGTAEERAKQLIDGIFAKWAHGDLAHYVVTEKVTKDVIGTAGFGVFEGHEHVGYAIAESRRGRGYATEATAAILQLGFEEMKLEAISALTFPENIASQGVLRRFGFQLAERVRNRGFPTHRYELPRAQYFRRPK